MTNKNETKKANNTDGNRPNTRSSLLSSGCIGAFYTMKGFFLKVKPAYTIDKVVFSFVQKGKSGEGFDIYVDIDKFDLLCDYILSRELTRLLKDSNHEHSAWEYRTGIDGSKVINIFQGNSGIVIHGFDGKKKVNANVPVAYEELMITAKWHRRIFSVYSDKMIQFCLQAMENHSKYYKNQDEDTDSASGSSLHSATSSNPESTDNVNKCSPSNNKQTISTPIANEAFITIKTSTAIKEYGANKNLCFMGYTQHNKELIFVIPFENIPHFNQLNWQKFYAAGKNSADILVNVGYVPYKNKFLVTDINAFDAMSKS